MGGDNLILLQVSRWVSNGLKKQIITSNDPSIASCYIAEWRPSQLSPGLVLCCSWNYHTADTKVNDDDQLDFFSDHMLQLGIITNSNFKCYNSESICLEINKVSPVHYLASLRDHPQLSLLTEQSALRLKMELLQMLQ